MGKKFLYEKCDSCGAIPIKRGFIKGLCNSCYQKKRFQERKQQYNVEKKLYRHKIKERLFTLYGCFCACCGETRREFLSLDHKKGGGCKHRKVKNAPCIYLEAIKLGPNNDEYQLLCFNCNFSKGHFGYCPHEKEREVNA